MRVSRFTVWLLSALAVLVWAQDATAAVSYASDLAKLNGEHERVLAALDAPMDQRYRAALTALLIRAQQEKDLELTATIQQALARLSSKAAAPATTAVAKASPAAAMTAAATPTVSATPAADPTSPVGWWRWHFGPANTLTEKGAVLQGANVVGQWKWTSKSKGEIQISWSGNRYRPPDTYTISDSGRHLNGIDPVRGDAFSEERIEQ